MSCALHACAVAAAAASAVASCTEIVELCPAHCSSNSTRFWSLRSQDYTPKADRQWWARLETVASLGWSAATFVGGWIISKHGFQVGVLSVLQASCQTAPPQLLCSCDKAQRTNSIP